MGIGLKAQQTMIRNLLILALLSVLPLGMSAQIRTGVLSDSAKIAEYREQIALDYSIPDYSVTTIVKTMRIKLGLEKP